MKKMLRNNYKFIISLMLILIVFSIKVPYYIDAPGGITDMSKKIEIDGYNSEGSFNLAYVREYRATIPTLLISLFNKDWNIIKQEEVLLDTEDYESYELRDKILMEESISNAIYVSYTKANKKINIISTELIVTYISESSNTDLVVGDKIICINNKKIGILISNINEYKTSPNVIVNVDKNESGSSGGLITALSIYDSLVKEDITNGLTIVGTGTIDLEGNIGSIGGVEYKLKSAVKNDADLFIVPNDENYKEALKIKEENNYDIEILGVSTFDEVINYLEDIK